jgi:hypothetical protein
MWYWQVPSTFVWAPLILLLVERSFRRGSWSDSAGAGVILGLGILGGNIQAAAHLGFLCVGYMAGTVLLRDQGRRLESLGRMGLVLVIAILVCAVQLLPTVELLLREGSHRMQEVESKPLRVGRVLLGIPFLATFMFPGLAGSTETYSLARFFGADMISFNGYIGIVPFVLFIVGALVVRDRPVRWLLLTSGGVLIIVFFTPLVQFIYHRFFVVVVFSECVVAAYGMDALLDRRAASSRVIRRTMIGVGVAGVMMMLAVLAIQWIVATHWGALLDGGRKYVVEHQIVWPYGSLKWQLSRVPLFLQHYRVTNIVFWFPVMLLFGAILGWHAHVRGWLSHNVLAAALLLFTVADLTVLGRKMVPQVNLRQFPLYPPLETISAIQEDHELFRVQPWAPDSPTFLPPSILSAYHLSVVSAADSLAPENLTLLAYCRDGQWTSVADLLNIKYVLVPNSVTLPQDHFSLVRQAEGVRLYRNNQCLPRLQFIPDWKVIRDRDALRAAMSAATFAPNRVVFIETDPPEPFRGQSAEGGISPAAATAQVGEYAARRVRAHVRCSRAGVVMLADTFYPGWQATVDGVRAPIYRADYVMRGVFVPAGDHEIEFRYAPPSFRLGAAISSLTLAGLALTGLWLGMRRRIVRGLA